MRSDQSLQFLSTFRHQASSLRKFKKDKYSFPSLQQGAREAHTNTVLIYFDIHIAFISHLKLGKNVLEQKVSKGENGTIVRFPIFPDLENYEFRGEIEDSDQVMWNIRDILGPNTSNRLIVYMIRDPYQKALSAIAQISISNVHSRDYTAYNFLIDKFKKHNRFYYSILEKSKTINAYNDEDFSHKFFKNSIYYKALYSYFDFVIKKYSSVLFLDNHLSVKNSYNVFNLLGKHKKDSYPRITIINIDSKKEDNIKYINGLYNEYGITNRNLLLRDKSRHSNFIYKPIVNDVLQNLSREAFLPFYLHLSSEYYYFRKILTKYRWAIFNKKF